MTNYTLHSYTNYMQKHLKEEFFSLQTLKILHSNEGSFYKMF